MENSVRELYQRTRSIRRFDPNCKIENAEVEKLIEVTRFCPSGANRQPLKYYYVNTDREIAFMMKQLHFAKQLKDWNGPLPEEYPSVCILILLDRHISSAASYDSGIAAQAILMAAAEQGFGGCMLGSINRVAVAEHYSLSQERFYIDLAVVIGKPAEQVIITEATEEKTDYWRGENSVHYVPKRSISELLAGKC